jgi:hypothetical protein
MRATHAVMCQETSPCPGNIGQHRTGTLYSKKRYQGHLNQCQSKKSRGKGRQSSLSQFFVFQQYHQEIRTIQYHRSDP